MLEIKANKVEHYGDRFVKQHRSGYRGYKEACEGLFLPEEDISQLHLLRCRSRRAEERLRRLELYGSLTSNFTYDQNDVSPKNTSEDLTKTSDQDRKNYLIIEDATSLKEYMQGSQSITAIWVPQENSWSEFLVTQSLFESLCLELQVFERLRDSLMHMGYRRTETEVVPHPLIWRIFTNDTDSRNVTGWECSYVLRFVAENRYTDHYAWSLRQFAVYNQSIPAKSVATWLFFSRRCEALADFECLGDSKNIYSVEFELHLLFAETVTASWRPYLVYLAKQVNEHSTRVTFADPLHPRSPGNVPIDLGTEGTQLKLRNLSDHVSNALTSLRSNDAQFLALISMLECVAVPIEQEFKDHAIGALRSILRQNAALQLQLSCIKEKLATCADIVARFTELSNGQKLRELALTAQEGNEQTASLAKKTQRDAAAVKGLTVVAIVFLPPTVVLNFYSTSFVDGKSGRIEYLPDWWTFLIAGIPMSVGTLLLWTIWIVLHDTNHVSHWLTNIRCCCKTRKNDVEAGETA